jgi:ferredoxin
MAYMITEDCIACGACLPECPNEAIREGDPVYMIGPEKCTECVGFFSESQCALVCPVEACVPDPDAKESREQLAAKVRTLHPGKQF